MPKIPLLRCKDCGHEKAGTWNGMVLTWFKCDCGGAGLPVKEEEVKEDA